MSSSKVRKSAWLTRLWQSLPFDGEGGCRPSDPNVARLRAWASRRYRQRKLPLLIRPVATYVLRVLWIAAAAIHSHRFSRRQSLKLSEQLQLFADCVASGSQPLEAWVWRHCVARSPHPLPPRALSLLLSQLGNPADYALLADKQAACARFAAAGLMSTPILAVIPRGSSPSLDCAPWTSLAPLFIKPRHGHAGKHTMDLTRIAEDRYQLGNGTPIDSAQLRGRLGTLAADDDLLVQHRLMTHPALADLDTAGRPPVLRITTARAPQSPASLYSALLSIDVPDEHPRHFLRGQLRAPVDLATGALEAAHWFQQPGLRYAAAPWNQAQLTGRRLPDFDAATALVLAAMDTVPGLPLVSWDLVLTPAGPVLLEGNGAGEWILSHLQVSAARQALLMQLLIAWQPVRHDS